MTEEKILRNNQIIDKYMGNVWDVKHPDYPKYSIRLKNWINKRIDNPPNFNESWDLLIPIAKKVLQDLMSFVDRAKAINYNDNKKEFIDRLCYRYSRIKYHLEEFNLELFYLEIVDNIVFLSLYENFDKNKDEPLHFF
jgi:hypothetical protein